MRIVGKIEKKHFVTLQHAIDWLRDAQEAMTKKKAKKIEVEDAEAKEGAEGKMLIRKYTQVVDKDSVRKSDNKSNGKKRVSQLSKLSKKKGQQMD